MKIINVTQKILKERMYIFRNQKVMLDFDLAEIYGYETKYLKDKSKTITKDLKDQNLCFD